ncbi:uncharacterized protein LOC108903286 [Anoplophora glabripennis]|uniref:uncharacterized protein LOC108903286 n=1 Tax=Anoplophora glabripennis TaxID=217634 RepID=UPI000875991A|nr:uncharacterized protein LOC108903286 [Anoplophora glabripennis]
MYKIFVFVVAAYLIIETMEHGMMLEPPNRSSLWRFNLSDKFNYDDNQNYCGGLTKQTENGGKCGVCGDAYTDPHPQDNENTGKYGEGIIVAIYEPESVIDVQIKLTANHIGTFTYSLCVLEDPDGPESGEDCFMPLVLEDGSTYYNVTKEEFDIANRVQLPSGITCERCVLRWHYRTGNNWGVCDDGKSQLACGPQETFRSCSDVAIL